MQGVAYRICADRNEYAPHKWIEANRGWWEPDVKLAPNGSGSSAPNDFGQVDGSGVSTVTRSLVSDVLHIPYG